MTDGKSFINIINRRGPKTDPCGTPLITQWRSMKLITVKNHFLLSINLIGSTNRKIDIFKITCKVLLCVGVGLIKKTLAWKIPCIRCSGKIEKYLQIELFSAVAICNLVWCNQSSFSGLVTIFPITLRHKQLLVYTCSGIVFFVEQRIFLHFTTWSSTAQQDLLQHLPE